MADTLTQEQIDAMLSSVLSGGDTASLDTHEEKEEIKEYDFRTPKKFTKEQIKILGGYSRIIQGIFHLT